MRRWAWILALAGCRLDVPEGLFRDGAADAPPGGTDAADAPPGPRCGDGTIRPGVEECDDGNLEDGDSCSALCSRCLIGDDHAVDPTTHHCYARFATPRSWMDALDDCAQRGLELATFQEAGQDQIILEIRAPGGGFNDWFGLGRLMSGGPFLWATGEALAVPNWASGEPNGGGDCARFTDQATWEDWDCGEPHQYICEDPGWTLGPANHAYKLIAAFYDWDAASLLCAALGGHLATVSSQAEQDFLDGWLAWPSVWLGGRDEGGGYAWTTGEPFTFTAWASGEPAALGPPACAATSPAGWAASVCTGAPRPAVCEID